MYLELLELLLQLLLELLLEQLLELLLGHQQLLLPLLYVLHYKYVLIRGREAEAST